MVAVCHSVTVLEFGAWAASIPIADANLIEDLLSPGIVAGNLPGVFAEIQGRAVCHFPIVPRDQVCPESYEQRL
jgi:hypothetical protein